MKKLCCLLCSLLIFFLQLFITISIKNFLPKDNSNATTIGIGKTINPNHTTESVKKVEVAAVKTKVSTKFEVAENIMCFP